eukprot:CAMPEP_0201575672 /NCGR_PEP_ID=MMETSP0190_2-20130828/21015_1 /ASSEMBLY_ACC=CAM_ASM_000263 /TAXON_ID=37353 /ORGANISM="Rosalina sp." /LENGTH=64 /DNA_ID=CAMNT_0048005579 /DNA_START=39 /DNA_END=234 /DNA_ORIENTATION=+
MTCSGRVISTAICPVVTLCVMGFFGNCCDAMYDVDVDGACDECMDVDSITSGALSEDIDVICCI